MAETFTKLLSSITDSSIWMEDSDTRIVWVTLLAMANYRGHVAASIPGIAARARVPLEVAERAIERFQQPDKYSRSQEYEGRRIAREERGWLLLNHAKIKAERDAELRRESNRLAQQKHRATMSSPVISGQQSKPPSSHSESDSESEPDQEREGECEREPAAPLAAPTTRPRRPRKVTPLAEAKAELRKAVAELAPSYGFEATPTASEARWALAAKTVLCLAEKGATRRDAARRAAGVALGRLRSKKSSTFGYALTDIAGSLSDTDPLTDPGTPTIVRTFYERLLEHIGTRPHWDARDAPKHIAAISKWADQFPDPKAELSAVFDAYLSDDWAKQNRYPLGGLSSSLPQLHAKSKGAA